MAVGRKREFMRLLLSYIKKQRALLAGALLLAAINQIFSLLDPQIFRLIIDNYATKFSSFSAHEFLIGVSLLLLGSMGVAMVSRIAKNFQDYYLNIVTQRVGASLYAHSIRHSFSLPFSAFEDQRSGELLQKLQKARTDVQNLIMSFVGIIFLTSVGMLFVVVYAFTVNWILGLTYLSIIPLVGFAQFFLSKINGDGSQKKQDKINH